MAQNLMSHQKPTIIFMTKYGLQGASVRHRFHQYFKYFEKESVFCHMLPLFKDHNLKKLLKTGNRPPFSIVQAFFQRLSYIFKANSKNTDLMVIYTELFPYFPPLMEWLVKLKGIRFVLDYDDAIFHQYDQNKSKFVRWFLGKKIDRIMRSAEFVIAGNQYIADYALNAGAKRVEIIPTAIDLDHYPMHSAPKNKIFTIVWIGSPYTTHYLKTIEPALEKFCAEGKAKVRLIGAGPIDLPNVPFEAFPWSEKTEVPLIQECHVGIMPLTDSPWERGKCGFKLIQYMGCSMPVIASPVGINAEIVDEGENGYLATSVEEWADKFKVLQNDPALLTTLGASGRKKVEQKYSLQAWQSRYVDLLKSVLDGK
jgi:glycosyltransferase involved in cell wall biosynthesis